MRERPILFSAPMVRAILAGEKTQTRRVVKPQPPEDHAELLVDHYHPTVIDRQGEEHPGLPVLGVYSADGEWGVKCPYGQPGDRLWVRETWKLLPECGYLYRADPPFGPDSYERGWKPSIHMPRAASRIKLEITDVRVQRLQAISDADCIAEGLGVAPGSIERDAVSPLELYRDLWKSINGADSWDRNPWVWAITFRRVDGAA